jgi:hypothetical protein
MYFFIIFNKPMKKLYFLPVLALLIAVPLLMSFNKEKAKPAASQWQVVTMVESVVPGKLGRSKMTYVDNTGAASEQEVQNLFSLTGINFQNLNENNRSIATMLAKMEEAGWSLQDISTGAFGEGGSQGIFVTRYLFKK